MELKKRFIQLVSQYTNDSNTVNSLWNDIELHYTEKHRTYHDLTHIEELFVRFDLYKEHIEHNDSIAFSIFYHDIIYNIWKQDNEEQSAVHALQKLLEIQIDSNILETVKSQIIATKTHSAMDNDTKWMIDFDLGILGSSPEIYLQYSKVIREEYQLIPNLIYKKGRRKVLQHFIDKSYIYATPEFRGLYEQQAKLNLTTELNTL